MSSRRIAVIGGDGIGPEVIEQAIRVADAAARKEIKQLDLGGGSAGIVILPDGSRALVAVSAKDKVASIDLKNLEITGYIPTGKNPDGLAWAQSSQGK